MQRTQIYLSAEQRRRLARRAADEGTSQAEVVRRILDSQLGIREGTDERVAIVQRTSGILAAYPDWPDWLADVRGSGTSARLRELGL